MSHFSALVIDGHKLTAAVSPWLISPLIQTSISHFNPQGWSSQSQPGYRLPSTQTMTKLYPCPGPFPFTLTQTGTASLSVSYSIHSHIDPDYHSITISIPFHQIDPEYHGITVNNIPFHSHWPRLARHHCPYPIPSDWPRLSRHHYHSISIPFHQNPTLPPPPYPPALCKGMGLPRPKPIYFINIDGLCPDPELKNVALTVGGMRTDGVCTSLAALSLKWALHCNLGLGGSL